VVLQVPTGSRKVHGHIDAHVGQLVGRTDPREHQQPGRIDGARAEDDLRPCADVPLHAVRHHTDADAAIGTNRYKHGLVALVHPTRNVD